MFGSLVFKYEVLSIKYVRPGRGSKNRPILLTNNSAMHLQSKGKGGQKPKNLGDVLYGRHLMSFINVIPLDMTRTFLIKIQCKIAAILLNLTSISEPPPLKSHADVICECLLLTAVTRVEGGAVRPVSLLGQIEEGVSQSNNNLAIENEIWFSK